MNNKNIHIQPIAARFTALRCTARYAIISSVIIAILSLTACLNEHPKGQVDEEQVYTSANEVYINAVASLYANIGSNQESEGLQGTCRGIYDYNTLTTDEAIMPTRGGDWYDGGLWQNMYLHQWTASDNYLYNVWAYLFRVIVKCNESLAIIESHKTLLSESEFTTYKAEVKAVRALFYYYAMDMFGRVPLLTTSNIKTSDVRQRERSTTFRFIVDELQAVAPLLADERSNYEGFYYGRITRHVAYFLLAKLALNAEIYSDDNWVDSTTPNGSSIMFSVDGTTMNAWQTCIYYCDLIRDAGYRLADDYASNFAVHNASSVENIFTIPLDKNLYTPEFHYLFRSRHYNHGGAYGCSAENGTSATLHTMAVNGYGTDSPDTRLGINFSVDTIRVDGKKVMLDNGEPLVYHPLKVELDLTDSPYKQTAGARMAKYEPDRSAYNDGKQVDNDIVLFRYADVLLMKAEAKVRNGESSNTEMNEVRNRVGMSEREATLESILNERLLELVWEGWRRQDLVRYGLYHKTYDIRTPDASESDGHTIVFPIPKKTLRLNPNLSQNPGY